MKKAFKKKDDIIKELEELRHDYTKCDSKNYRLEKELKEHKDSMALLDKQLSDHWERILKVKAGLWTLRELEVRSREVNKNKDQWGNESEYMDVRYSPLGNQLSLIISVLGDHL